MCGCLCVWVCLSVCPLIPLSVAGLGEFRIRDLNDEINKLLREKGHWEYRIKELGGPNYRVIIQEFHPEKNKNSTQEDQCVIVCVCVVCRSGSGPGCWIMRGRKFQETGDINILEQPEICQESENCLRESVSTQSSLPVSCQTITVVLGSNWRSMLM